MYILRATLPWHGMLSLMEKYCISYGYLLIINTEFTCVQSTFNATFLLLQHGYCHEHMRLLRSTCFVLSNMIYKHTELCLLKYDKILGSWVLDGDQPKFSQLWEREIPLVNKNKMDWNGFLVALATYWFKNLRNLWIFFSYNKTFECKTASVRQFATSKQSNGNTLVIFKYD